MKYIAIISATIASITSSNAAITTLNFELSRGSDQSIMLNGSTATITNTSLTNASNGSTQTSSYSITGLTLDNVGTGDDSITFDLILTGTGTGTVDGFAAAHEAWGVQDDNGGNNLVDSDESISFSFGGGSVTLGPGAVTGATMAFDGFTSFKALNVQNNESYNITGTTASNVNAQTTTQQATNNLAGGTENAFTIEGNTGAMRYYHIGTQVTITSVPEPASTTLLGIGGLSLILRRRK